jgi:methylated-DNA-[protein]-cysteine S-methyltransferase/AraC family transcriptional regulator of adaptative response/methylated-DNA-[protein]-cysteine methyltransferase
MNLMIAKGIFWTAPAITPAEIPVDVLSFGIAECALGQLLLARSTCGVCAILIGDGNKELVADLAARFPESQLVANETPVHDDLARVIRFVDKPAEGLYLPLDMRGTPFQRRVWQKIKAIPAGRTVTYMELARWISPFASPRAVASACAANSIALAIPCHRVVCGNTDLAGYHWGIERKRELIRREAKA